MSLNSLAIKCADLDAMRDFYSAITGADFIEVDVGVPDMRCLFGKGMGMTLKLVSGREAPDFEGYPIHQIGLGVEDIEAFVETAKAAGGRQEGELARDTVGVASHGCVRDPDGNTIELVRQ